MRSLFFLILVLLCRSSFAQAAPPKPPVKMGTDEVVVYRSLSCGCCGKWLEHLRQNQFNVVDKLVDDVQGIKDRYGVTPDVASCHTAIVDGYVVEGHVPAADIRKLLAAKPKIAGIAVPGMPVGTPGMEMGEQKDAYKVIGFAQDKRTVFSEYGAVP